MNISSNVDLPVSVVEPLLQELRTSFLEQPVFQPVGLAIALETGGPGDGVGVSACAYDQLGRWQCIDLADSDNGMALLENWVALTYPVIGPWLQCLIQIIETADDQSAHFEFDFEDMKRWIYADYGDRFFGDMVRPKALPIPLKPGPHF